MSARSWDQSGRAAEDLWRGARLARAHELIDSGNLPLEDLALAFVEASERAERAQIEAEKARQRRELRRTRIFAAVVGVAFLIAVGVGFYAISQKNRATENLNIARKNEREVRGQARIATSGRLVAASFLTMADRHDLALLLGAQSWKTAQTYETRHSLLSAIQHNPRLRAYLFAPAVIAFSPDSTILATAGWGGIQFGDVETFRPLGDPLSIFPEPIADVAFSPDGALLASASWGGTLVLVDMKNRQPLENLNLRLPDVHRNINSIAFSPDGRLLAAGGCEKAYQAVCKPGEAQGIVRLWDIESRQPLGDLLIPAENGKEVFTVAFSPDGNLLAAGYCLQPRGSGCGEAAVRFWNVADPQNSQRLGIPLRGSGGYSVVFSPDGATLASVGDGQVQLWDSKSRQPLGGVLSGHVGSVSRVAFSPDGKTLAAGVCVQKLRTESICPEGAVVFWNVEDVRKPQPIGDSLTGHQAVVNSMAYSPNSAILAAAADDAGTIRLWNSEARPALGIPFGKLSEPAISLPSVPTARSWPSPTRKGVSISGTSRATNLVDLPSPVTAEKLAG